MRIICTTHNVSEAKITNQLIDTCATYSSVDALLYGQPDGCYLAPGVVRRLTAVCKEPTHFPSGELFEEEINDRQFVFREAPQQSCARTTHCCK
ncbi:Olfactory receptor [Trichinella spiralis]|uniref:Olfactory receptor n=1 Tax=Trichinella spiralis TaxID=6334 RepID=A0ABR3KIC7_TRISP